MEALDWFVRSVSRSLQGGGKPDVDRIGWARIKEDAPKIREIWDDFRMRLDSDLVSTGLVATIWQYVQVMIQKNSELSMP